MGSEPASLPAADADPADWHQRVVRRSLRSATQRSIDRGALLIAAAAALLERSEGDGFTVQEIADEARQSLRTLYQYFESKDDLLLALFEEGMSTYASLMRRAIAPLDDPLDRLAGALLAAASLPASTASAASRGLARVRLRLAESRPELIGRAQRPVASLLQGLLVDAMRAGSVAPIDPDTATFLLLALNTASINAQTLGNDFGAPPPSPAQVVAFCLAGLGATIELADLRRLQSRIALPAGRVHLVQALAPAPAD